MSSLRHRIVAGTISCVIACLVFLQAGVAVSQPGPDVAGLVIDYGNGARTYALIPVGDETISGLDLLEESGLDLLTIGFGGMGIGVCAIEMVGCDISACQGRLCQTSDPGSPFWNYLRSPAVMGDPWRFSSRGVSASTVAAGDVDAWFWTGGRPTEPSVSVADIAKQLDVTLKDVGDDPIVRTFGSLPVEQSSSPSGSAYLASSLILVGVTGAAVVAVRRARPA